MLISQKLEAMTVDCKDARSTVGAFMLEQRIKLQDFSMQQVADATFTSRPTLVRIAKKLGYSGWNELVKKYVEECRYYESHFAHIDPNFPFEAGDSTRMIADKVGHVMVESILDTLDMLDHDVLSHAAALLARANRAAMLCISPNSIVISYSGNNERRAPMRYLAGLWEKGVPIIAITSAGDNLLRSQADYVLSMSSREKLYSKVATFATEDSISFLLNTLYACCFALNYEKNLRYKIDASRKIELERYTRLREAMEEEFPLEK